MPNMLRRSTREKELGIVYTPPNIAQFLSRWAVRSPDDLALEPAAGRGSFIAALLQRFESLGYSRNEAAKHIVGLEIESEAFKSLGNKFPQTGLLSVDFLSWKPPKQFDAVVGNPPYVERQILLAFNRLRSTNEFSNLHQLTDIYGYFIVKSGFVLKPGGRLAFIVSDTWLNMDFGEKIKEYLLRTFQIKALVSFDNKVFPDAQVRTVLLLAEKKAQPFEEWNNKVVFVRLRSAKEIDDLDNRINGAAIREDRTLRVEQDKLRPDEPWGPYLKPSGVYFSLLGHPLLTRLANVAITSTGLFTLANGFYIIDHDKKSALGLEDGFIDKIVLSPRDAPPIIDSKDQLSEYVLLCQKPKSELRGTHVLKYIESGESTRVSPVGKRYSVTGYNNLPRLRKAHRTPWYNLVPEIDRRCRAPILIPRRVYRRYAVIWNKAFVVASDNFVCVKPRTRQHTESLLGVLNSSLTEYLIRVRAQTYGGGINDLRPDDISNLLTIDLRKLPQKAHASLAEAYRAYADTNFQEKGLLDEVVFEILRVNASKITGELRDLVSLSQLTRVTA